MDAVTSGYFPNQKTLFPLLHLLVKQINKIVQQKCQKSIFYLHLQNNHYSSLDAAQWVAELQCEPECIIRNIIDNTFYNKNVVVSNPRNPLASRVWRINPTDFRDFSASRRVWQSRGESRGWGCWEYLIDFINGSPSLCSSLDFKQHISRTATNHSGGFMNRACRWLGSKPATILDGRECNVCDPRWHLMLTVGQGWDC